MKFLTMPQFPNILFFVCIFLPVILCDGKFNGTEITSDYSPLHYDVELRVLSYVDGDGILREVGTPGKVKISMERRSLLRNGPTSTSFIVLHASKGIMSVNESSVKVRNRNGHEIPVEKVEVDRNSDQVKIQAGKETGKEERLEVSLDYTLVTTNSTSHFICVPSNRTEKWLYHFTMFKQWSDQEQFLLPCVRDNSTLSTFQLTVIRKDHVSSISNTDLHSSLPDPNNPGWFYDRFKKSPLMRPNSLSFALSNFESLERVTADGTLVRVHAPRFLLEEYGRGNFSADVAVNVVDILSDYFNGKEPHKNGSLRGDSLPTRKIDIVMANFLDSPVPELGIITLNIEGAYVMESERKMNDDPLWGIPSWEGKSQEQRLALDLIRPLIHQYFFPHFDYVDGLGWTTLGKGRDIYEVPPLKILRVHLEQEVISSTKARLLWKRTSEIMRAFQRDYEIREDDNPRDFLSSESFGFPYRTGHPHDRHTHVLEMLADENVFGMEAIRHAILAYHLRVNALEGVHRTILSGNEHKNIFAESLQNSVLSQSPLKPPVNVTAAEILDSWRSHNKKDVICGLICVISPNDEFIVVKVDVVNDTHLSFTQERIQRSDAEISSDSDSDWHLPVTVQTHGGQTSSFWLSHPSKSVTIPVNHTTAKWVLVDPNATGIHRTFYDPILLRKLKRQLHLDHTVFNPLARMKLVTDYLYFLNPVPYSYFQNISSNFPNVSNEEALGIGDYLDREGDLVVWTKIFEYFSSAHSDNDLFFIRPPLPEVADVMEYLRPKYRSILESIDLTKFGAISYDQLSLEGWVLLNVCMDGSSLCQEKVKELLRYWKRNPDVIKFQSSRYRKEPFSMLTTVLVGGGKEAFDFVVDHFVGSGNATTSNNLVSLAKRLSYSNDAESLKELFLNLTAPITRENELPRSTSIRRAIGNGSVTLTRASVGRIVDALSEGHVGSEVYRKFFYEECDRIAIFLEEMDPSRYLPKTFTKEQYDELSRFLENKPDCLKRVSEDEIKVKLQEEKERMEQIEKWMKEGARKFFSSFAGTMSKAISSPGNKR